MPKPTSGSKALEYLEAAISELSALARHDVPPGKASALRESLRRSLDRLARLETDLDPIAHPNSVFDPSNPNVMGAFIGVALYAQPRVQLAEIEKFYGSGVYALYYDGDFPSYQPLVGTEHPIYTGKSDPASPRAESPVTQGEKLSGRLREHAKSIGKAQNLALDDFTCRYLVVASGWQGAAERFLIEWFQPIWNNEISICYGIGKHGDSPSKRGNDRSPWDTMHPGREWAYRDPSMPDKKPLAQIETEIREHFERIPPLTNQDAILHKFFDSIRRQL